MRRIPTETYFSLVRQQLAENGRAYVRVTGESMRPILRHLRDGVVIVPPDRIRRGDIVLFDRMNGRYALHRVIRVGKAGFVMAGDNQWHFETDLPYNQIVGVVSEIDRSGKIISVDNFFYRMFTFTVVSVAFPRIYIHKIIGRLAKFFRRFGKSRKGIRG